MVLKSSFIKGMSAARLPKEIITSGLLPAKISSSSSRAWRPILAQPSLNPVKTVARAPKAVLEEDSPVQKAADLEKQWQKQQQPQPGPPASPKDPLATVASPALFLGASLGFMLTTFEVFHPNSTGLLLSIDASVHQFALGLPTDFRFFWANVVLSHICIALGILGSLYCTGVAVQSKRQDALMAVLLCFGIYSWGMGFPTLPSPEFIPEPLQFDAHIVTSLKDFFERVRPSPMLPSYSYPSGHTSSVTYIVGSTLFILLPSILDKTKNSSGEQPKELLPKMLMAMEGSVPLWIAAAVITVTGRCCADAHWFSDCVGGGCLSLAAVSGTAMVVRALVQPLREAQKAEDKAPRV